MSSFVYTDDLDKLEYALRETLDLVEKERLARRTNWALEDKDEWRRRRVNRVCLLLAALARYP